MQKTYKNKNVLDYKLKSINTHVINQSKKASNYNHNGVLNKNNNRISF